MKQNIFHLILLLTCVVLTLCTCNKTSDFQSGKLEDYMNMQVGKYILYELDSTVFTNFNTTKTEIHYQAKDVVNAVITDSEGRPSWRVIRYMRARNSTNEADWKPNITYMVTVLPKSVEVVEENQRYIKLQAPIKSGFEWRGNSYISAEAFEPSFSIDAWKYTYEKVDSVFTFDDGRQVENTITINQRDEVLGNPNNPYVYTIQNFSKEVYAKGIGLVYKDLFHSEYQTFYNTYNCYFVKCTGNVCDTSYCAVNNLDCENKLEAQGYKKYCRDTVLTQSYYSQSYGIRLKMIGHN